MRKPVSKHALRRAMEQLRTEGRIRWDEPTGAVVDQLWHQLEKEAFGARKKPVARDAARTRETVGA
jgi:DNA-binding GntR family transcriptional regulator